MLCPIETTHTKLMHTEPFAEPEPSRDMVVGLEKEESVLPRAAEKPAQSNKVTTAGPTTPPLRHR